MSDRLAATTCTECWVLIDTMFADLHQAWHAQAKAEAVKPAKASEVADVDVVLPCGCVHPCEGHHEDES